MVWCAKTSASNPDGLQVRIYLSSSFNRPCLSYTIVFSSVRGDNLVALTSGLSPVPVDSHGITMS